MRAVERTGYTIGALLLLSGIVHAGLLVISGGSWEGPLSLRKPATFGLSFGLTLMNVTWIASLVQLSDRTRNALLGAFTAACVLETFLVSLQAWRGVPSHFNVETPFDAAVAQTLAVGGFTLIVVIIALTVAAMRDRTRLPPAVGLAIRAGLVALVGAQIAGGLMIATGMRVIVGGDPQRAYATAGWLKPVHAVLMHGILVLPLLAWFVSTRGSTQRTQSRAVWAAVVFYAVVVAGAAVLSAA